MRNRDKIIAGLLTLLIIVVVSYRADDFVFWYKSTIEGSAIPDRIIKNRKVVKKPDVIRIKKRLVPKRENKNQRRSRLDAHVRGYVIESALSGSLLEIIESHSFTIGKSIRRYKDGKTVSDMVPNVSFSSVYSGNRTRELNGEQVALLLDVFNIINREKLFLQVDEIREDIIDGGWTEFRFVIGDISGRFRLTNISPRHLDHFLHKIHQLNLSVWNSSKDDSTS